ncbi:BcpO-related WXXGXW repeat protein [Collimonas pratensis]|nr:BcpO-related WXXGXW repeat protein [Collimonas pratensis]
MKRIFVAVVLVAISAGTFVSSPALAQIGVDITIGRPPPPPRYEPIPPSRDGYVWIPGFWDWRDGRHIWADGHWEPSRPGFVYAHPEWHQGPNGWILRSGGWHEDHRRYDEHHDRDYRDSDRRGYRENERHDDGRYENR